MQLSSQNRHAVALQLLLTAVDTREKREGMGMKEVREWREMVWTVERDWARRRCIRRFQPDPVCTPAGAHH